MFDDIEQILWIPSNDQQQSDSPHTSCGDWVSAAVLQLLHKTPKATAINCNDLFQAAMRDMKRLRQEQINHFRPWLALLTEADMTRADMTQKSLTLETFESTLSPPSTVESDVEAFFKDESDFSQKIPLVATPCTGFAQKCIGCVFCRTTTSTPLGSLLNTAQFNNLVDPAIRIEPKIIDILIESHLQLPQVKNKVCYIPLVQPQAGKSKRAKSVLEPNISLVFLIPFSDKGEYILCSSRTNPPRIIIFGSEIALQDKEILKSLCMEKLTEFNFIDSFRLDPAVVVEQSQAPFDILCYQSNSLVVSELWGDLVTLGAIALLMYYSYSDHDAESEEFMTTLPQLLLKKHAQFRTMYLSKMLLKRDRNFFSDLSQDNQFKIHQWGPLNKMSPVGSMILKSKENKPRY